MYNDVDNDVNNGSGITELIRLEIPDLFLDILGLQIHLDLFLLVTAGPEGGLLGQLLAGLGREV